MRSLRLIVPAAVLALALCFAGVASAHRAHTRRSHARAHTSGPVSPQMSCGALATDPSFAAIPHYPTAIASATDVAATGTDPAYCDVKGMIAPQTHFEMKLPESTWQGRYIQDGCGGYCGNVSALHFPTCATPPGNSFALATDDEGHTSSAGLGGSGLFAFNSQKLRKEYGYESEQAMYVVAKAIMGAYYGQQPSYSYYEGCSDGGREAMEMAERYPTDFNGIIAGAPEIIAGPLNAEAQTWFYKVNTDANGNAILTDDKLPALAAAVVKACGGDDGVPGDGIITDPQNCHFDPASIQCAPGQSPTDPSCLTPAQVTVVREFYQGPADPQGRLLYPGGAPYGSELGWSVFQLPPSRNGGSVPTTQSLDYFGLSLPYLRYQYLPVGQLGPDPSQWQFTDSGFRSLFPVANIYDAMSTDLRAFRAHGGKLIMWQGAADNGIPPTGTIDYYDTLTQRMGGPRATADFARLFMFPTVFHCGGGYGGVTSTNLDLTQEIVNWVENGQAPTQVDTTYTIGGNALSRPVYPYPLIPAYNGHGQDPTQASSFHPVVSPGAHYTNWLGNYLFYEPIGGGRGWGGWERHSRHA